MNKIKTILLVAAMLVPMLCHAQIHDPVRVEVSRDNVSASGFDLVFKASIERGWHVYSTGMPSDGPISTALTCESAEGVEPDGELKPVGKEIEHFDNAFGMTLRYFENEVSFVQHFRITQPEWKLAGYLEYGTCNDRNCLPPAQVEFSFDGSGAVPASGNEAGANPAPGSPAGANASPAAGSPAGTNPAVGASASAPTAAASDAALGPLWTPVVDSLQSYGDSATTADRSLIYILIMGFLGGLLALFTPCVWPIIPMTVSFFLKRSKNDRKKGVKDAVTYGVSIIVIYLTLGLLITAIFGASSLNALATNAVFNILFFLLLVIFALSFFGWFEIRLPSKWSNSVDSKADSTGGIVSIFLMAFTLTLVSFSCTGPIIGFLLVEVSTAGSILGPAVGMFGFALALAIPFTLFALFPTWLNRSPKSGSWMNTIKVSLGFVELAFSLKFFSVADQAYGWGLLNRDVFLCLWIVIFALLGAYLVGWLRFQSDEPHEPALAVDGSTVGPKARPVACIMLGMLSFALAVYMIPGLWGAPCKMVSAFAPPMATQEFNVYHNEVRAQYTDYEAGMAAAKAQGKPVVIDFTGYGCVNCRKMEAAVWTDAKVASMLNDDYVLISLYVDDKTPLPERITVTENGQTRTLRTIGDKWSYLQRYKFGSNAQPFYIVLDAEGRPLTGSYGFDDSVSHYTSFLREGLDRF